MARPPRCMLADCTCFHVFARGVDHLKIFRDREDRLLFLQFLARAVDRDAWRCHAFCLMDTHVHVVVEARLPLISRGMQRLLGAYAQAFNRRHARVGHVFGDRYGARAVDGEGYLAEVVDYVVQNPVRAGLVEAAADWPWAATSHSTAARLATSTRRSPPLH